MELILSDSDSDLEVLAQLSDWVNSGSENEYTSSSKTFRRINFVASLTDAEFTFRFRINKAPVEYLLNEIMPFIKVKSQRNNGILPLHQLLLALRFYALGTMLNSVADFAGVSSSSVCRIVADISAAIAQLYTKYMVILTNTVGKYYNITQFPRVFGAIDCTHVHIQSPSQCEDGIFGNRWLLGGSAYPNRSYRLTPLLNPTSQEIHYNETHIKTRNTIERSFGVWKCHFPVISLTMHLSICN